MARELTVVDEDGEVSECASLPALSSGQTLQRLQGSFATAIAVQKARNLADVQRHLLEEARLAGEDFYYGWGAGKDRVEGPSVQLAYAAARCWGNCGVEPGLVQEMSDAWIITSFFIDLETGFTSGRQFRQSKKSIVYGRMDDERKNDSRFQNGQSKSIRNVIISALPKWLIDKALDQAKAGVREKIEKYIAKNGLPAAVDLLLNALAKCGVREERVLAKANVAKKTALTVDDLVILRGDLNALETGQERAETLFAEAPATANQEAPAARKPGRKASRKQLDALQHSFTALGMDDDQVAAELETRHIVSLDVLTEQQAAELLNELATNIRDREQELREPGAEG